MKHAQLIEIIRSLKAKKVKFEHGLSDLEVQIELSDKFPKNKQPKTIEFWSHFDDGLYNDTISEPYYRFDGFDDSQQLPKITFSFEDNSQRYSFILWEYYLHELIELLQTINPHNWSSLLTGYQQNNDLEFMVKQPWCCEDKLLLLYNLSKLETLQEYQISNTGCSITALTLAEELTVYLRGSDENDVFIELYYPYEMK